MKDVSELSDWDQGTIRGLISLSKTGELTQGEARQTAAWIRNGRHDDEDDE